MKLWVECRINVDGTWWDIVTEHKVHDALLAREKLAAIQGLIRKMAGAGPIISRVAVTGPPVKEKSRQNGETPQQQARFPELEWPPPHCKVHNEPLKESTVQKTEGFRMFFCPKRMGDAYCTHRAKVEIDTGVPKFWEVRL